MVKPSRASQIFRGFLGAALFLGLALPASSCVSALDLDDRHDAFVETCDVVDRCFGGAYVGCTTRVEGLASEAIPPFLENAPACVEACSAVYDCLDFEGICKHLGSFCDIDADCCGVTIGLAACDGGACCAPAGAPCDVTNDRCCDGQGPCDETTGTCGGVYCAPVGFACLNDFQCCTGRCGADKLCAKAPCPPEGFECDTNEDCCDLLCRDGRCEKPPECALISKTCKADLPCCDPALFCDIPEGATEGICTDQQGCFPANSDCFSDDQCCDKYCDPKYKLCGQCALEGDPCSAAAPCCALYQCSSDAGNGNCELPPMP